MQIHSHYFAMKILICSENTLFSTITVAESVCREISADTMTLVSITVKIFILFTSSGRSYFFVDFFQSHPCQSVLFRFFAECPERPASPFRHFINRVCFNLERYPSLTHDGLYIYVECRIRTHAELLAKFVKLSFQVRVQSDGCCCLSHNRVLLCKDIQMISKCNTNAINITVYSSVSVIYP